MILLLDTHIFLWFITNDSKLPLKYSSTITNLENEVYLSVASSWEMLIKYQIGKLSLPEQPSKYIAKNRRKHRIRSLAIYESSIKEIASLPLHHNDPFDRLIIAQSIRYKMTLLTLDEKFQHYPVNILTVD